MAVAGSLGTVVLKEAGIAPVAVVEIRAVLELHELRGSPDLAIVVGNVQERMVDESRLALTPEDPECLPVAVEEDRVLIHAHHMAVHGVERAREARDRVTPRTGPS